MLSGDNKTNFITGGSLGARTLNKSVLADIDKIIAADVQLIWQTGKHYYPDIMESFRGKPHPNIKVMEFVDRMDLAYAAADIIISRAGGTISELRSEERR